MSMHAKRAPRSFISSPHNALKFPAHVVTITDNSLRPEPEIVSDNYTVVQPFFTPRGITGECIVIEGADIVNNFKELNGNVNTIMYGASGTVARRAVESGFSLAYANLRPENATYPNFYVSLDVNQTTKKANVYWTKVTGSSGGLQDGYHYALTEEELKANLKELKVETSGLDIKKLEEPNLIPVYEFGFRSRFIEGLTIDTDLDGYLSLEEGKGAHYDLTGEFYPKGGLKKSLKYKVKSQETDPDEIGAEVKFSYPIFGAAYRGASSFDNVYRAQISTRSDKLDRKYPYYHISLKENDYTTKHEFDFTLFTYSKGNYSYSFKDRMFGDCNKLFTATNRVNTFIGYMHTRREANRLTKDVKLALDKLKSEVLEKMKTVDSGNAVTLADIADPTQKAKSQERLDFLLSGYDKLVEKFTKAADQDVNDTPLSTMDIFDLVTKDTIIDENGMKKEIIISAPTPGLEVMNCPSYIQFAGGSLGDLEDVIKEGEFDFYQTIHKKWYRWDNSSSDYVVDKEDKKYYIWQELYKEFYTGKLDPAIFDQTIVKDSIMFGENYPNSLQEVLADLCKYKEDIVHCENTRPDFTYIRTPENNVRTMNQVKAWVAGFEEKKKNHNMHPCIGSWMFNDASTNGQERFSGWFEYLGIGGSLYSYIASGTSNSFAQGDSSVIFTGIPGTEACIPTDRFDLEFLADNCIMYYGRRSSGYYGLADDSAFIKHMNSSLKNVGSCIHFNNMLTAASNVLLDSVITNTDKDSLDKIKRKVEKAIQRGARHFDNRVTVEITMSTHVNEIERDVVLCTITVAGHTYSRHNRLNMVMERAAA